MQMKPNVISVLKPKHLCVIFNFLESISYKTIVAIHYYEHIFDILRAGNFRWTSEQELITYLKII